jgi:actin-like ATPase involved in cell morphogenesis
VEQVPGGLVADALTPIVTAIGKSVDEILSDIPSGLAEDIVRGKLRLSGGGAQLPGLAAHVEAVSEIGAVVADDPLRSVIRGAAAMLELDAAKNIPVLPA